MGYISLEKAFLNPNVDEKELYAQRFNSDDSIHIGIDVAGYPAFFVMTSDIYASTLQMARDDKEILRLQGSLPVKAIQQFAVKNLVDEIVITNEIEGVNSTRKEIHDVLASLEKKDKRGRYHGLVNKYLMLSSSEGRAIETPEDVRAVYDELVLEEVLADDRANEPDGKVFRQNPVAVYTPAQKKIHDGVMPESAIISMMEKSLEFLNDEGECDALARIAAFHFLFGYIHPFYDGNGRTNRYISSHYLARNYEAIVGYGLSYSIKKRLNEYYKGFVTCEGKLGMGDLTPFVSLFCDIASDASSRIRSILASKKEDMDRYGAMLDGSSWLNEDEYRLSLAWVLMQAALFSDGGASMDEITASMQASRQTVYRRMDELAKMGYVEKHRRSREMLYSANLEAVGAMVSK